MNIVIENGAPFAKMSCRSIAEVMGLAPEWSSEELRFPVTGYEMDMEENSIPCLGVKMMSDARWNELTAQQVVKNFIRVNGKKPENLKNAFEWQRQWVRELTER